MSILDFPLSFVIAAWLYRRIAKKDNISPIFAQSLSDIHNNERNVYDSVLWGRTSIGMTGVRGQLAKWIGGKIESERREAYERFQAMQNACIGEIVIISRCDD